LAEHGCGGYVTHVLYFDDVKAGILSIMKPQDPSSVEYLRFSAVQRSERTTRS
jgi:hypothetical protein